MRRRSFDLDVSAAGLAGVSRLAADLVLPATAATVDAASADAPPSGPLLICVPGGGMSRRYFDLHAEHSIDVPGQWSMAEHLADRFGIAVAAIDHPGIGDSDMPEDPWSLVPSVVADIDTLAVASLLDQIDSIGAWRPTRLVGCGHSMGGMLLTRMQSRHRRFEALVYMGFCGTGLEHHLGPAELAYRGGAGDLEAALPELARARFGTALRPTQTELLEPDGPRGPRDVLATATTDMLTMCGLTSMIPGTSDAAMSVIDVPVFCSVGEHDIAVGIDRMVSWLAAAPTVETFVLPASGHNHVVSRHRTDLWDAVGRFVTTTAD